jgi:broad specificity phosphatase PhoE
MTTFYVLRHADKEHGDFFNPRLRHHDQPLSPQGQQEARQLGTFFAGKPIAAIYVSGYQRTGQTIAHVAQQLQLTPVIDERLNEIDNGRLDGLPDLEIQQTYPEVWAAYQARSADFRFPEGETGAEAQERIIDFLREKRQQHDSENIILVSHEGLIRLLMCTILDLPVYRRWNFHVDTCGLMEMTYRPDYGVWKLLRFNQICG